MLQYVVRPIDQWPGEPTRQRQPSAFTAKWSNTLDILERELRELRAKDVVIQADVQPHQLRNDGMLRAEARPASPKVILSFESKHGPLSYPCDRFHDWQDNVRAIALALEALRKVDRYGVTRKAEQYKGWSKLPPPNSPMSIREAAEQLRKCGGGSVDVIISSHEGVRRTFALLQRRIQTTIRSTKPTTRRSSWRSRCSISTLASRRLR